MMNEKIAAKNEKDEVEAAALLDKLDELMPSWKTMSTEELAKWLNKSFTPKEIVALKEIFTNINPGE